MNFSLSVAVTLLFLSYAVAFAEEEAKQFDARDIKELDFRSCTGTIKITGDAKGKATVKVQKVEFPEKCEIITETRGKRLRIETKRTGIFKSAAECKVNYEVSIPADAEISLMHCSGEVSIEGVKDAVSANLGNGSFIVKGKPRKLDLKIGNGSVKVEGLEGNADVILGNGDIDVAFGKDQKSGELNVKVGNGNTSVTLPKDAKVEANYTGSGRVQNDFPLEDKAAFEVSVVAGRGDLKINKTK